jgi:NAD(P)H-binding
MTLWPAGTRSWLSPALTDCRSPTTPSSSTRVLTSVTWMRSSARWSERTPSFRRWASDRRALPRTCTRPGSVTRSAQCGSDGAAKLVVISAVPAGPWEEQPLLQRRIALPILRRFFGASYDDMRRMEAILQETTDVDWISLRPPRLVDKPSRGTHRVDTRPLAKARAITYGDLAAALLDSLTRRDLFRHAAYVAN